MRYETGKAPGQYLLASATVSSGKGDPGGRSYGAYQLASKTGTLARFLAAHGKPWLPRFDGLNPKEDDYADTWRAIAAKEGMTFFNAQHTFIKATHYDKAILKVHKDTNVNLDIRTDAVRNAIWSMAVQHGGAAEVIESAIHYCKADATIDNDLALLTAMYAARVAYVDNNPNLKQLLKGLHARYAAELDQALADAERAGVHRLTVSPVSPATPATSGGAAFASVIPLQSLPTVLPGLGTAASLPGLRCARITLGLRRGTSGSW